MNGPIHGGCTFLSVYNCVDHCAHVHMLLSASKNYYAGGVHVTPRQTSIKWVQFANVDVQCGYRVAPSFSVTHR